MDALFDHISHWLLGWDFLMIVPSTLEEFGWHRKGQTKKEDVRTWKSLKQNSETNKWSCDVDTAVLLLSSPGSAAWELLSLAVKFLGHLESDFGEHTGSFILDVVK